MPEVNCPVQWNCLQLCSELLLSPVPSFTSEPTPSPPKPPIFFIPYLVQVPTYLLIFLVLILFIPAFLSVWPFPIIMRLLTMLTQPHVPTIAPPPELRYPLLPPNSGTCSRSAPWLQTPPVFKPAVSIDTNQSDYCVSFLACHCV